MTPETNIQLGCRGLDSISLQYCDLFNQQAQKRSTQWRLSMWNSYPRDLFQYEKLTAYFRPEDFFYEFKKYNLSNPRDGLGWKLHLSVHIEDLPIAFNLAVPLLAAHCDCFKVVDLKQLNSALEVKDPTAKRFLTGTQVTVYLQYGQMNIKPTTVKQLIIELDERLRKTVRPGTIPESDIKTHSNYFSIRNDMFAYPPYFSIPRFWNKDDLTQRSYLSAKLVGRNYNPCHFFNPYHEVVEDEPFKLKEHFLKFFELDPEKKRDLSFFVVMSILAFLREVTEIDILNDYVIDLFKRIALHGGNLPDFIIKNQYLDKPNIRKQIQTAMLIACWQDEFYSEAPTHFASIYPIKDDFRMALELMDQKMAQTRDSYSVAFKDPLPFLEFCRSKQPNIFISDENTSKKEVDSSLNNATVPNLR